MNQLQNKRIAKEWHEAFGTEDLKDKYDIYLDDDFTADFFGQQQLNKSQYIIQYQKFAGAFKENKITVEEQFAEDDKVVSVIRWTAIHMADLPGMLATGLPVNIKGIAVDHFKNGRAIKHYLLFDTAQLLKRYAIREKVRTRLARDLHDNIGSTLGSISYYSEMAQQLPEQNLPQLKLLLHKIEESSHELVEEMNDMVWAINPLNDSFEKLTTRMKNYAANLLATRNIEFSFEMKDVSESLRLSIEQRKNIFLIFKEGVYNAVKYSCCSRVTSSIRQENDTLIFELHDNGKGFDVKQGGAYNGNGINNMRVRAEEIEADFSILSKSGNGTHIRLLAPLGNS